MPGQTGSNPASLLTFTPHPRPSNPLRLTFLPRALVAAASVTGPSKVGQCLQQGQGWGTAGVGSMVPMWKPVRGAARPPFTPPLPFLFHLPSSPLHCSRGPCSQTATPAHRMHAGRLRTPLPLAPPPPGAAPLTSSVLLNSRTHASASSGRAPASSRRWRISSVRSWPWDCPLSGGGI